MISSLVTGIFLIAAAICGLARHGLLSKSLKTWPTMPTWAAHVLFAVCAVLIGLGLKMINVFLSGSQEVPPNATAPLVILSAAVCVYKVTMLANTIIQRRAWVLGQLRGEGWTIDGLDLFLPIPRGPHR